MTNITFSQHFTFPEESVKGFAVYLGWSEKLTRQITVVDEEVNGVIIASHFESEEYDNPQTFAQFVEEKAITHTLTFTKSWAEKLKEDALNAQIDAVRATNETPLHEAIVKPVEDALVSEIIIS